MPIFVQCKEMKEVAIIIKERRGKERRRDEGWGWNLKASEGDKFKGDKWLFSEKGMVLNKLMLTGDKVPQSL